MQSWADAPVRVLGWVTLPRVLIAAVGVRLLFMLASPNAPTSDQIIYHQAAIDLASGLGYIDEDGNPANWWPVGYAAYLSLFYGLLGPSPLVANFANLLSAVVGVAAAWGVGMRLAGRTVASAAALFLALSPGLVMQTTVLATEGLFVTLSLLILHQALVAQESTGRAGLLRWLGVGVGVAASVYVRPNGLLFVGLPLVAWVALRRVTLPRALAASAVVGVITVLLLLPWGFRNLEAFGKFSLTSMNGGSNLWIGNNPASDGGYMTLVGVAHLKLVDREATLSAQARQFIRENPGKYLELCARRIVLSLRTDTAAAEWNSVGLEKRFGPRGVTVAKGLSTLVHWAILVALGTSLVLRRRRLTREDAFLFLLVSMLAAPAVLIVGGNRYMIPSMVLAGVWCALSLTRVRQERTVA